MGVRPLAVTAEKCREVSLSHRSGEVFAFPDPIGRGSFMAGKPQISVILPFFEGGRWLGRSVPSVLAQEGLSFELLVIDDGSRLFSR